MGTTSEHDLTRFAARGPRAVALWAGLVALTSACRSDDPAPAKTPIRRAPEVAQGRPTPEPELPEVAELDLEVTLRASQTRVGEAVRVHVSLWRAAAGSGEVLTPTLSIEGPAEAEAVGRELLEARGELLRERFDFRVEPSAPGAATITVAIPGRPERRELELEIRAALAKAELAALMRTHGGQLERGRSLARQGDYRRAIEVFRVALDERPDEPGLLGELGWAAFLADQHNLARRATREALRLESNPDKRGSLLYNLGRVAEALGRDDEARVAYRRSLAARPSSDIVSARLAALEARRPRASLCVGPPCPLAEAVTAFAACELIEEESCALFESPGHCRCSLDPLEALGPWRLLTLVDPGGELGVGHVYVLLFEIDDPEADEPRYHLFPPLLASRALGAFRGGIESANLIPGADTELLRVDFAGQIERGAGSDGSDGSDAPQLRARAWTLLCAEGKERPTCAAPLLTEYETDSGASFVAPVTIESGRVVQIVEAGVAPDPAALARDFPGRGVQVLGRPRQIDELLAPPGPG
ncbi:Tetratricopeptide repeat protein [Enhygromyxa salina]|uniref:Tetratricopeptide repeat protein n=1 Tax=Enhygromyxa salina TaxID=215803 RepID=A0A2S9XLU0_9BACT|nr:tetratricopeptide repeat protein [Enhygromyxa salina]PRP93839.1 Tetratricopeptide repeat protein [Enhygromyxa salina]